MPWPTSGRSATKFATGDFFPPASSISIDQDGESIATSSDVVPIVRRQLEERLEGMKAKSFPNFDVEGALGTPSEVHARLQTLLAKRKGNNRLKVMWIDGCDTAGDVLTNATILQELMNLPEIELDLNIYQNSYMYLPSQFIKEIEEKYDIVRGGMNKDEFAGVISRISETRPDVVVVCDVWSGELELNFEDFPEFRKWLEDLDKKLAEPNILGVELNSEPTRKCIQNHGRNVVDPSRLEIFGSHPGLWPEPKGHVHFAGFFDIMSPTDKETIEVNHRIVQDFIDRAHERGKNVIYLGIGLDLMGGTVARMYNSGVLSFLKRYYKSKGPQQWDFIIFHNFLGGKEYHRPRLNYKDELHMFYGQVDMSWLFERVDAAWTYAGAGTTRKLISAGVPSVHTVHERALDQEDIVDWLREHDIGVRGPVFSTDRKESAIGKDAEKAFLKLINNEGKGIEERRQKLRSKEIRDIWASGGGTQMAVELIERFACGKLMKEVESQ